MKQTKTDRETKRKERVKEKRRLWGGKMVRHAGYEGRMDEGARNKEARKSKLMDVRRRSMRNMLKSKHIK